MPIAKEVTAAWIGAAAVIVSVFLTWYLTNLSNQRTQGPQVTSPEGIYLWQVTADGNGDRWAGYINVDQHGVPNIQMWRLQQCPNNKIVTLRLLKQDPGAEVTVPQPGKLRIHIPVRFIKYDNKCQVPTEGQPVKLEPQQILEGDIDQTIGYEGNITYIKQNGERPFGGMILVKSTHGSAGQ
jgi:hypothetical protein